MNIHFSMSEFLINPSEGLPIAVADKILKFHIPELNLMRIKLGDAIYISGNSGYRSVAWEKKQGRSGNSQHTFIGKGAVDITCDSDKFQELVKLAKQSNYKRIAIYPDKKFIHLDFNADVQQVFINTEKGWDLIQ